MAKRRPRGKEAKPKPAETGNAEDISVGEGPGEGEEVATQTTETATWDFEERRPEMTVEEREEAVGGETVIEEEVIASIVGIAAREVEGVASLGTSSIQRTLAERLGGAGEEARGVDVEVGKKEAIVNLELKVIYGFSIPKIVSGVREKVAARLMEMAGLAAKEINLKVVVAGRRRKYSGYKCGSGNIKGRRDRIHKRIS